MQILAKSIDDFKSDRKGITPPLPIYLRILPVLFYLTIAAAVLLNALFLLNYSQAGQSLEQAQARDTQVQAELQATKLKRTELEGEAKRASDIASWVEASRPLQPLVVAITRSIEKGSSLVELRLDRDAQNPAQIRLSLKLMSDEDQGTRQLDLTLAQIANLRFRAFSPQQTVNDGEIDYQATLLWLDAMARDQKETSPGS